MSDRCHSQLMLCHMIASRQLLPSCRVKTVQGRWAEQKARGSDLLALQCQEEQRTFCPRTPTGDVIRMLQTLGVV